MSMFYANNSVIYRSCSSRDRVSAVAGLAQRSRFALSSQQNQSRTLPLCPSAPTHTFLHCLHSVFLNTRRIPAHPHAHCGIPSRAAALPRPAKNSNSPGGVQ